MSYYSTQVWFSEPRVFGITYKNTNIKTQHLHKAHLSMRGNLWKLHPWNSLNNL